jgi:hypothetical protein
MAAKRLLYIVPKNEGQELNYSEPFTGTREQAGLKAEEMRKVLQAALRMATITVEVQNIHQTVLFIAE